MEWLETLFFGAFLFGLLFSIGSVVLGIAHGGADAGTAGGHGLDGGGAHLEGAPAAGHLDAGAFAQGAGHAHAGTTVSPWNLTSVMAFVAWFGGIGYLALTSWQLALGLTLLLALLAGLVGWAIVYFFYARILAKGESRMDPDDYRMEGTVARVTLALAGERIGEIQYVRGGARRSVSARSLDGAAIPTGTEVVVVRCERGIAQVQPWETYLEESTAGLEKGD